MRLRCEACIAADPAHSPEISRRRGEAISARKAGAVRVGQGESRVVYDPELFEREILPRLQSVKLMDIAEAAGCCKRPRRTSGAGSGHRTCRPGQPWLG